MKGEQYYLILIHKDGTKYRVYNKPVTLRTIDERTTKYLNKKELVSTIIKNTKIDIDPNDIKEVQILMKPNSKKEEYRKERGPLYKKDENVLYVEGVASKFELMMLDKSFVRDFIKKYKGIKNFNSIANTIEAEIRNNTSYVEDLSFLAEKLFSTYKGSRNIYLSIVDYENKKSKKKHSIDRDILDITDEERREMTLRYLQDYDRELLDIEDFNGYEDISLFDAHKTK